MVRAVTIEIRGVVQGVGLRPFVYGLARELAVAGSVLNRGASVRIEAEGSAQAIDELVARLVREAPAGARIDGCDVVERVVTGQAGFQILVSDVRHAGEAFGAPDRATCERCLAEHDDPADRRAGYPFISCAACGPRLTMVYEPPYDRERTAMARFPMCAACRAEYDDPADRRFHVEGIACAACGPQLAFEASGERSGPLQPPTTIARIPTRSMRRQRRGRSIRGR